MNIPLVDLKAQHQPLKKEILNAIATILDDGDFILGKAVTQLETEFAKQIQTPFAIGVANGTDALILALKALELPPGSQVAMPANTYFADVEATIHCGYEPLFVDVDPQTYLMDLSDLADRLTDRTRAILAVHLYGQMIQMPQLMDFAEKKNLLVVEDCAQSFGASLDGKPAGSFGHVSCFSFFPSKPLGCIGDGGIITTPSSVLHQRVRSLRNHGSVQKNVHQVVGFNSRLDSIQAAVVTAKLPHTGDWLEKRRRVVHAYGEVLANDPVILPLNTQREFHALHLYVIRTRRRDELLAHLRNQGIEAGIHYPTPCHLQPATASLGYQRGDFPITERLSDDIVTLPLYAEMTLSQVETIGRAVRLFHQETRSGAHVPVP